MSEAIKPTPGPWLAVSHNNGSIQPDDDWTIYGPDGQCICFEGRGLEEDPANAALIAEAGTVHHETGLTPRQLVEQRDALEAALSEMYEFFAPNACGSSENRADALRNAEAALALEKGATP